ncbi:S66 peptidase family protein [Leucobacter sp. 1207-22]|uniref:S66 peptidase family protein n=1 Tax=Leucobacter sp. 1207-22 TaxID=2604456 RepID=UPI004062F2C1
MTMRHTSPALRALEPGARCALVSPSGPSTVEAVEKAEALLRSWGLEPVRGAHVLDRHERAHGYLAGSDADRAADLTAAWTDPSIDAVFCVRGGYGAIRILDLLDADALAAAEPKPLIGSSDITALHEFWQQRLGVPTWFTPMIATNDLLESPNNVEDLRVAVLGAGPLEIARDADTETLVPGVATGDLTGGNLSLLAMNVGSHPSTGDRARGKIVLIEEVHESPYRIDGLMQILLRSGYFDGAVAVGLGTWVDCGDLDEVKALMRELLEPLGVPVIWGLRFGHGPDVSSFPIGAGVTATLIADDNPRIEFAG